MKQVKSSLSILTLLLLLVMPSWAQEGTEIAPDPTQEIIVVEVPAPVVEEVPVVIAPVVTEGVTINLVQVIIGLLGAFAAGGIVGIAGLATYIDRIRNDKATVTALEKLGDSFPPSTKELLERAFRIMEKASSLGVEVFDGVPIADKVVQAE
jgi:hypothetical protein